MAVFQTPFAAAAETIEPGMAERCGIDPFCLPGLPGNTWGIC